MKKAIEEKLEFKKFIKDFYSDYIQLNFTDYFILKYDGKDINIFFPNTNIYKIFGIINLDNAPNFKDWIISLNSAVKIYNSDLDNFRKAKISDVLSLEKNDSEYSIKYLLNGEEKIFSIKKIDFDVPQLNISFNKYKNIPLSVLFNEDVLTVFEDNDDINFGFEVNKNIIFEFVIKELQVIFKPAKLNKNGELSRSEAQYTFFISEADNSGMRYVKISGEIPNICKLEQIFKVI